MIRILVFRSSDEQIVGIEVKGHSGFAKKGADPVCAAVSVLAENLAASLEILLELPVKTDFQKGFCKIFLESELINKSSELLFSSVLLGFKTLSLQFPQQVHIEDSCNISS